MSRGNEIKKKKRYQQSTLRQALSTMEAQSQKLMLSTEPSTKGFAMSTGKIWIYPENYPVREYQFCIVQTALYHNTLVCLPTGLGKTFIAAVVMFNFWRWYPQGKIVFLAPTKPLVAQQINACQNIMGIPSHETVELTGATDQKKRQVAWANHRVIFATPQVFHKDLEKDILPSHLVKCVIIDEAHKALGKHSYCESIRLLSEKNQYFRIVGLSATPGGKLDAVQDVVRNLHITHLELRDDTSSDVVPYLNKSKLDIIMVSLGTDLEKYKERYVEIMDRHHRVLVTNNVLRGNTGNLTKGRLFHVQKEWFQRANKGSNHGIISKAFTILMTMSHAYDLLVRHGLRAFMNFYENHKDKFWLNQEEALLQLLEEINYFLGPFPDVRPLPDGSILDIPNDIRFGHNKFYKLQEILVQHFESYENKKEDTRAIVFVEYKDIVNEVYVLLLKSRPLLRPQMFVGQSSLNQRQQRIALEDFRCNKVNVLISTSVGEEGLDVGEVDLIVCFDISQQSPTRLVQRMGRTGRKRDGHIVVLVTDGKEHQTLKAALQRRDSLNTKVMHSSGIINALFEESPRMVPPEFNPECFKMHLEVQPKIASTVAKGKAKEPNTTRKRAEKSKNSKHLQPSTSNKTASQSSMLNFLKRPREDNGTDTDSDIVSMTMNEVRMPASQQLYKCNNNYTITPSDVKLLSSDNAAVDFLTLCTMKNTENVEKTVKLSTEINSYIPSYTDSIENFFDFTVPNLKILDCFQTVTDYVEEPNKNLDNDDVIICDENSNEEYWQVEHIDIPNNSNPNDDEILMGNSKFEVLLDDSSSDSDITVYHPTETKNDDVPVCNEVDWDKNVTGLGFDELFNESSDDSIAGPEKNEIEGNAVSAAKDPNPSCNIGAFEAMLNDSSDEDETQINLSCSPRGKLHYTEAPEPSTERSAQSTLEQASTSKKSLEIINDNESQDLLDGYEFYAPKNGLNETPESSVNARNFERISESWEKLQARGSKNGTQQDATSTATTSQTLSGIDQINSKESKSNADRLSFGGQGQTSCFDDRRRDSWHSRQREQSQYESKVEVKSLQLSSDLLESNADSEEDIFGVDDLLLDSDFEEEIKIIEKSAEVTVNNGTKDENKFHERNPKTLTNEKHWRENGIPSTKTNVDLGITVPASCSSKTSTVGNNFNNSNWNFEAAKNGNSPRPENSVADINLDDCDWDNEDFTYYSPRPDKPLVNERKLENSDRENQTIGDRLSPTSRSPVTDFNIDDLDWESDDVKYSSPRPASGIAEIKQRSSNENNKTVNGHNLSSIPNALASELNINDCDWSSDFEVYSTSVRTATCFQNNYSRSDLQKACNYSLKKTTTDSQPCVEFKKATDETGWITTKKEKSRLSLHNKFSNIRKKVLTKLPGRKESSTNAESDSENDFVIGKISKNDESDYFAKPAPLDTVTRPRPLAMSNSRKLMKGPLSFTRNTTNKLPIKPFNNFAAPDKYTQQQKDVCNNKSKDIGRQKCISLDDDPRRKKKKHTHATKRRTKSEFIDDEAEVSTDSNCTSGSSGTDDDLENFVSYTQNVNDSVDMQAHYLQTMRSPVRAGGFHIRKRKIPSPDVEIYSQYDTDTYVYDSFCVAEDDVVFEDNTSTLEEIERNLQRKKRKRRDSTDSHTKRSKIILPHNSESSSSEDETELLRRQIADESLALKNKRG